MPYNKFANPKLHNHKIAFGKKILQMKHWLIIMAFFAVAKSNAQQNKKYYSKEFSVQTDNDVYLLNSKDGYYTNGIFLEYSIASEKNRQKKIDRFVLGQTMFTTGDKKAVWRNEESIDRPYCGYLFAKYIQEKFIDNETIFGWNFSLGVTGKWSLAQQLQDSYHKIIHVKTYPYWETQITNSFGFNAGVNYTKTLASSSIAKMVAVAEANAGMHYTNIKAAAYFCLGAFEKNNSSALLNARANATANNSKRKYELFFYFHPILIAQGYNATTQGTLFYKTNNAVTCKPQTFMYQHTWGIAYAASRVTGKLEATYQTKEASTQNRQQRYASIHFAYLFN